MVGAAARYEKAVVASFIFTQDIIVKSIGFTLAFGVIVDGFVVRRTLVPAALALCGKAAWWLPGPPDRLIPNLDIEGEALTVQPRRTVPPAADVAPAS